MPWLIVGEAEEMLSRMLIEGATGIRRSSIGGGGFEEKMVERFKGGRKVVGREKKKGKERRKMKWAFWVQFSNL